jgi:lipopolysaccharide transport system ATP-binding protein
MSDIVVRAEGLSKRYRIGQRESYKALRDVITDAFTMPFRRSDSRSPSRREHIWALKDVSFEVRQGEVVGVIGRNGAGKSTMLKILSRITRPTVGEVVVRGRVGSLLEVGTGFHPELTGRENVFLNGAILGMRKAEITRKFDEIVSFAEMEKFIDTPVKHYSIGMYMRLAFAVAANLEPEILIVDEVLAVGDAAFQKKCLGKMSDVAKSGRTVLFVSHNMDTTQRLCTRCMLFERGQLLDQGGSAEVIDRYLSRIAERTRPQQVINLTDLGRFGTGEARFVAAQYSSTSASVGYQPYTNGPLEFTMDVEAESGRSVRSLAVIIYSEGGTRLVNADTGLLGQSVSLQKGRTTLKIRIDRLHLNPGIYRVGLRLANPITTRITSGALDFIESAFELEVVGTDDQIPDVSSNAVVNSQFALVE